MNNDTLIVRYSNDSLDQVCARLPDIAQKHQFGVLGQHNLREKLESKGVKFAHECRVFEVCNPQQAKAVLDQSLEISTALPCRIAVYAQNGKTTLATIKPTALLDMFGVGKLGGVAQEVERKMTEIMDEVAGGRAR
jgi:uncharacterized protein (DUF302 family)